MIPQQHYTLLMPGPVLEIEARAVLELRLCYVTNWVIIVMGLVVLVSVAQQGQTVNSKRRKTPSVQENSG